MRVTTAARKDRADTQLDHQPRAKPRLVAEVCPTTPLCHTFSFLWLLNGLVACVVAHCSRKTSAQAC